jgi:hypothetical protein
LQKNRAIELKKLADKIALNFSRTDREFNHNNETFEVSELIPLSESTALIRFKKSSGKYGMAFCYWINMSGGQWQYFFPTYDHCVGMEWVREELRAVEVINFGRNFE